MLPGCLAQAGTSCCQGSCQPAWLETVLKAHWIISSVALGIVEANKNFHPPLHMIPPHEMQLPREQQSPRLSRHAHRIDGGGALPRWPWQAHRQTIWQSATACLGAQNLVCPADHPEALGWFAWNV